MMVSSERPLRWWTLLAVALPFCWALQWPPQPAFASQALATALWSLWIIIAALQPGNSTAPRERLHPLLALWLLPVMALAVQGAVGWVPAFALAPALLNLLLAALLTAGVARCDSGASLTALLRWLLTGILFAALGNALAALVQQWAPQWADDRLIAALARPGERASGNLRQPNQLATLMVWGMVAATHLLWRRRALWCIACTAFVGTLLASGSRAGVISLLVVLPLAVSARTAATRLTAPAAPQRRHRHWPVWLALVVAVGLLGWALAHPFARDTADASLAQRVALWPQALALWREHPLAGVGWSQFNFVWTLTPFANRAPDVFDHAHNLPLQMLVELGAPAALALALLLLRALAVPTAWRAALCGPHRAAVLSATALLLAIATHSLFEYPLWFSYFLLPTACLLAILVRLLRLQTAPDATGSGSRAPLFASAGALTLAATLWGVFEYSKAVAIHTSVAANGDQARAVERARGSPLYGHYGDYAAIMLAEDRAPLTWFARPIRNVLDERLLAAWARALEREGQPERAAFISARAREFPPHPAFVALPVIAVPLHAASMPRGAADFRKY